MNHGRDFVGQIRGLDEAEREARITALIFHKQTEFLQASEICDGLVEVSAADLSLQTLELVSIDVDHPHGIQVRAKFALAREDDSEGVVVMAGTASFLFDRRGDMRFTIQAAHASASPDQNGCGAEPAPAAAGGSRGWIRKCQDCGKRFVRDRETYDFVVCPACLERARARREGQTPSEAETAESQSDWANSILECCSKCKSTYKAKLTDTGPKVCPRCRQGGITDTS